MLTHNTTMLWFWRSLLWVSRRQATDEYLQLWISMTFNPFVTDRKYPVLLGKTELPWVKLSDGASLPPCCPGPAWSVQSHLCVHIYSTTASEIPFAWQVLEADSLDSIPGSSSTYWWWEHGQLMEWKTAPYFLIYKVGMIIVPTSEN